MSHNATPFANRRIQIPTRQEPRPRLKLANSPRGQSWNWRAQSILGPTTATRLGPWLTAGTILHHTYLTINSIEISSTVRLCLVQQGEEPNAQSEDLTGSWDQGTNGITMLRLSTDIQLGRILRQPGRLAVFIDHTSATTRHFAGSITFSTPAPVNQVPL